MQDVLGVHGVDGQGNVIECVLDELLRVLSLRAVFENDLFLASQIHVVHEHPDAPLELKKFDDLYDKVTVDEWEQTRFIYDELLDHGFLLTQSDALESKKGAICETLNFENLPLATLTNRLEWFVDTWWILGFAFYGIFNRIIHLIEGSQSTNVLFAVIKHDIKES